MAFKSQAQRRHLQQQVSKGLCTQARFDALDADTPHADLPERVRPVRRPPPGRAARAYTRTIRRPQY